MVSAWSGEPDRTDESEGGSKLKLICPALPAALTGLDVILRHSTRFRQNALNLPNLPVLKSEWGDKGEEVEVWSGLGIEEYAVTRFERVQHSPVSHSAMVWSGS
jgi:hypothetical protein